jgi:RNA 2',3'-cyclic 3'-phosphodiesterase
VRLFFALWPGDRLRETLARVGMDLARRAHGRPVPAPKLHMTLAFLGEVPPARFAAAAGAASRVASSGFDLALDEVGSFRAAHVAWAGSTRGHPALTALQAALARELRGEGFALEDRPFAAHVTLARGTSRPIAREPMPALSWRVRDFVLVASDTGKGSYEVGRRWKLGG